MAPEPLPEEAPSALRARRDNYARELQETKAQLAGCAAKEEALARREEELEYDHMRAQARDQLAEHEALAALQGFVPVDAVAACRTAARDHGWGLVIEDPAPDEAVPTLIRLVPDMSVRSM